MKNITAMLQNGNLTPKERVLFLVHNYVNKDKTGNEILTEADKHTLCEGWKPKDNYEVKEYNRYNNGWRTEGGLKLDAQTIYLNAQVSLLKTGRLVDYVMFKDYTNIDSFFKGMDLEVSDAEALEYVLQNSGLLFDSVIYGCTFQNLSEDIRQDILTLCPDAENESQYLDQEEMLADLFNDKKYLTEEAKKKLTDLILDSMRNKYANAEIIIDKVFNGSKWWTQGYFADLPVSKILKKWAEYNKISWEVNDDDLAEAEKTQKEAHNANQLIAGDKSLDKELRKDVLNEEILNKKMTEYADMHKTDMGELLKQTILNWLEEGLFVTEYSPMCNSNNKQTCNDADTKLTHKEIFKQWITTKNKAKASVEKLMIDGQLRIENRETDFFGMKETKKMITGESLYNLEGDFSFASDFKKQVDDLKPLGCLTIFARKREDFFENYASLLAIVEIYKKLSKIYEIDLGYKIENFLISIKVSVSLLNKQLNHTIEKLTEFIYKKHHIKFLIEITDSKLIHLEEIEPGTGEMETSYSDEFKKILENEF
jgi:hypothetical protein